MRTSPLDQPITLRRFIRFYEDRIEPRFDAIDNRLDSIEHSMADRFDFLFKSREDVKQEYRIICHQLKRSDSKVELIEEKLGKIPSKWFHPDDKPETPEQELADIKFRLEASEAALQNFLGKFSEMENWDETPEYDRQILAWDIRILRNMVEKLEKRLEDLSERVPMDKFLKLPAKPLHPKPQGIFPAI